MLILVKPTAVHIPEITAYRDEWRAQDSHSHGDGGLYYADDIPAWIEASRLYENIETIPNPNHVPGSQFMLMREGDDRILGMIALRHYLQDGYLTEHGGHIGYGVRPTERRKGYAKAMLELCLEECRKLGLKKVLLCCDLDNHGSRATIKACGGKFERLGITGAEVDERYWITLDESCESSKEIPNEVDTADADISADSSDLAQAPLEAYYGGYDEDGRLLTRHGFVEYLTTMRYVDKYLKKGAKVLEIGAGTGRYSRTIADMGYTVDALELVPSNIEIFRQNMTPGQAINIAQGNALDLSMYDNDSYDITLLLGPMYHLYTAQDKRQAISEAIRVTKPGGVIFVAYVMSDPAIVEHFVRKDRNVADLIARGLVDPITFATMSRPEDIFELVRRDDINELMEPFGVNRLHIVGTNLIARLIRETLVEMDDEEFALYLRYHFAVCERQDMIGVSSHVLDVFRKG